MFLVQWLFSQELFIFYIKISTTCDFHRSCGSVIFHITMYTIDDFRCPGDLPFLTCLSSHRNISHLTSMADTARSPPLRRQHPTVRATANDAKESLRAWYQRIYPLELATPDTGHSPNQWN